MPRAGEAPHGGPSITAQLISYFEKHLLHKVSNHIEAYDALQKAFPNVKKALIYNLGHKFRALLEKRQSAADRGTPAVLDPPENGRLLVQEEKSPPVSIPLDDLPERARAAFAHLLNTNAEQADRVYELAAENNALKGNSILTSKRVVLLKSMLKEAIDAL